MYKLTKKLILYHDLKNNNILSGLAQVFQDLNKNKESNQDLIDKIYLQINKILKFAGEYKIYGNVWHSYLAYLILMDKNPFSLTYEMSNAQSGSLNHFAMNDFKIIKQLFDFDFKAIEKSLNIDCFKTISNYKAMPTRNQLYNSHISEIIEELSTNIDKAEDETIIFKTIRQFYINYGVGVLGLNRAFRFKDRRLLPIKNIENVTLDDLIGYEVQKKELIDNTLAFVEGRIANNLLLYGDSGTGKSTSIKALINKFYNRGLRMIEIYKNQFSDLSDIISKIKNRNYRFIIYMDDLSFEEFETEYKFLKAIIEGSLETKPDNVLIYASSNRRHLIRESWGDRNNEISGEIHGSDTVQEKLSLVDRFGITINYSRPTREEFFEIVIRMASKYPEITLSDEELIDQAQKWEMWNRGISGRTAQQFINYLIGQKS